MYNQKSTPLCLFPSCKSFISTELVARLNGSLPLTEIAILWYLEPCVIGMVHVDAVKVSLHHIDKGIRGSNRNDPSLFKI
jgi:hypothetical protein